MHIRKRFASRRDFLAWLMAGVAMVPASFAAAQDRGTSARPPLPLPPSFRGNPNVIIRELITSGVGSIAELTSEPPDAAEPTRTFDSSGVDVSSGTVRVAAHRFKTGDRAQALAGEGALPGGMMNFAFYFIVVVDPDTVRFTFDPEYPNATRVKLTSPGSGRAHKLVAATITYYRDVPLTTDGKGSGCTATIQITGGRPTEVVVTAPGQGFAIGDKLFAEPVHIGGVKGFSAVVTGVGIGVSRTSGRVPAFVQVSVCGVTAIGSDKPYEDVACRWDFGDPDSREIFHTTNDGLRKNANSDQQGPEAAYVYRTPGRKTITLTIEAWNGREVISTRVSYNFMVSAFEASGGTFYFDTNLRTGANDGTSEINAYRSLDTRTLNRLIGENVRLRIACGSHFKGRDGISSNTERFRGLRIDTYVPASGNTDQPIVEVDAGPNAALFFGDGYYNSPKSDVVVSNLKLVKSSPGGAVLATVCLPTVDHQSDFYWDRLSISHVDGPGTSINRAYARFGGWGVTIEAPLAAGNTSFAHSWFGGAMNFAFLVGCSFSGYGKTASAGEEGMTHPFYFGCSNHGLVRWTKTSNSRNKNNNKYRSDEGGSYHCVEGNDFSGHANGIGFDTNGVQRPGYVFRNVVVENNAIHDLASANLRQFLGISASGVASITVRDNRLWGDVGLLSLDPSYRTVAAASCYRNRYYGTRSVRALSLPGSGWTRRQVVTDNVICFDPSVDNGRVLDSSWQSLRTSKSTFLRNRYWAGRPAFMYNDSSPATLPEWRAYGLSLDPPWDADAQVSVPGNWTVPPKKWSDMA